MKPIAEIKIDKNVPVPEGHHWIEGKSQLLRRTLRNMKIGHSFLYPDNHDPYRCANQAGVKIKMRKQDGNGYRVWRIK